MFKKSNSAYISFCFYNFLFLFCFFYFVLVIFDIDCKMFYINNLIFFEIQCFTIYFVITLWFIFRSNNQLTQYPIDLGFFFIQLYTIIVILLVSNNLLSVFLALEVVNILILYSFFITTKIQPTLFIKALSQNNWILKTCVYQFILNFFSSIFFFWSYNNLIAFTQTTNFFFLNHICCDLYTYYFYISLVYTSFFIKLGIGPWIFFKIEVYQNFNIILLLIYTVTYFIGILIFFFNLFYVYMLPITGLFLLFIFLLLTVTCALLAVNLYNYFNIYMFFSFSSFAHLIIFLFQFFLVYNCVWIAQE